MCATMTKQVVKEYVSYFDPSTVLFQLDTNVKRVLPFSTIQVDTITPEIVLPTSNGVTKVKSVTKETVDCVRVVPVKGSSWLCPTDCLLAMKSSGGIRQYFYGDEVQLHPHHPILLRPSQLARFKLYNKPIEMKTNSQQFAIHPYVLGYFLCRGELVSSRVMLRVNKQEVFARIEQELLTTNNMTSEDTKSSIVAVQPIKRKGIITPGPGSKLNCHRLTAEITGYFVEWIRQRFPLMKIPLQFLTCTRAERALLLSGILDAVSYFAVHNNVYDLTLRNKELIQQIAFLARSLGLHVRTARPRHLTEGTRKRKRTEEPTQVGIAAFTPSVTADCEVISISEYEPGAYRIYITGDLSCIQCSDPNKIPRRQVIPKTCTTGFKLEYVGDQSVVRMVCDRPGLKIRAGDWLLMNQQQVHQPTTAQ
jgi:hypothetical protein